MKTQLSRPAVLYMIAAVVVVALAIALPFVAVALLGAR